MKLAPPHSRVALLASGINLENFVPIEIPRLTLGDS